MNGAESLVIDYLILKSNFKIDEVLMELGRPAQNARAQGL